MKLLSLNGGGTLGYITIGLLAKAEEATGKRTCDQFDMISGVSTGSIIGYTLASGKPAAEVFQLYKDLIPCIFRKKRWLILTFWKSLYRLKDVRKTLEAVLGEASIGETECKFSCWATRVDGTNIYPKFWKSWREKDNISAVDALTASSAAPHYFEPFKLGDRTYVDGGIVTNSPNISLMVDSIDFASLQEIKILNVGINNADSLDADGLSGVHNIVQNVANATLLGSENMADYHCKNLMGERYKGVFAQAQGIGIDSKDFKAMDKVIEETWELEKENILSFFK